MPIYEYRCGVCGKKSTFITLSVSAAFEPRCQHCGSADVRKLVSRVAVLRSEERGSEIPDDPGAMDGLDENDPRSMDRLAESMGPEMGEDGGEADGGDEDDFGSGESGPIGGPDDAGDDSDF